MADFVKINAIIRESKLDAVTRRLRENGISGMTITHVKGIGEGVEFFSGNWCTEHARIEIFCAASERDVAVESILELAHTGRNGDGLVAVLPVDDVYRIRTKNKVEKI